MIVVDSSVRIDHFNGAVTRETGILDTLFGVEPIMWTPFRWRDPLRAKAGQ